MDADLPAGRHGFADDERRIRTGHGAESFARLSWIAMNLLTARTKHKAGIKRNCRGWSDERLARVQTQQDQGLWMRLPRLCDALLP